MGELNQKDSLTFVVKVDPEARPVLNKMTPGEREDLCRRIETTLGGKVREWLDEEIRRAIEGEDPEAPAAKGLLAGTGKGRRQRGAALASSRITSKRKGGS